MKTNRQDPFQRLKQGLAEGAPSPLDQIPVATKRQRDRRWERRHRARPYRGVPPETHAQVVELASRLSVTVSEVVQVMMQYGLSCLEDGSLTFSPRPRAQRMTLFPDGWSSSENRQAASPTSMQGRKKKKRVEKPKAWRHAPGYRLSDEVHSALKSLAEEYSVPIGEVVTLFLQHGLRSYENGKLTFHPRPKVVKMTILEGTQ